MSEPLRYFVLVESSEAEGLMQFLGGEAEHLGYGVVRITAKGKHRLQAQPNFAEYTLVHDGHDANIWFGGRAHLLQEDRRLARQTIVSRWGLEPKIRPDGEVQKIRWWWHSSVLVWVRSAGKPTGR